MTDFSVYRVITNNPNWRDPHGVSPRIRFRGIPIALLDEFKAQYRGRRMKLRWRGPRAHRWDRNSYLRQSVCTREDALTFSVYQY